MEFKENRIKDPFIILALIVVCITSFFNRSLNPYGLAIMIIGFIPFLYAKIPNLKEKRYFTSGVDQIKEGYKIYYSSGMILMLIGFILLFT